MPQTPYTAMKYQAGETPVFCYRSGMAVYEEALIGGVFVSQGYNAAGYPLSVLTNCPTRLDVRSDAEPFAFSLEVDGANIGHGLSLADVQVSKTDARTHSTVILDSAVAPVRLYVHTVLDGTAMFTRWLEIENLSDVPHNLNRLGVFAGGVEVTPYTAEHGQEAVYALGCFDGDAWGEEGQFSWHDLPSCVTCVDTRFRRDRYRHPLVFLRNNRTGLLWFVQMAYPGGCRFAVDCRAEAQKTSVSWSMDVTGYAPLAVLQPRERFVTPEVHVGVVHGDLDDAVNAMHEHARRSVFSDALLETPLLVGGGMGAEHDMSVATSKAFIDQFAAMGAEVFIVDAGWQNPPGDEMKWEPYNGLNRPDAQRYPHGLREVSEYCREKGLKFALWVEIERLGEYSEAFQRHPEWRLPNLYGEQAKGYMDFTNPEAAAWAESELARIIEEYRLDMLRIDHNSHSVYYHAVKNGEYTAVRHFEAVCAMYRRLKARFPQVIFENCAGGGGRTDYAMMKAFHHTWVSDWQVAPRSVLITGGMTMALPPERVDRLFAGMNCHTAGSLSFQMRNTMFGHMSLNVTAPAALPTNPEQLAFVKHSVTLYKSFIRPFLPTCKIYHATPDTNEAKKRGYYVLEAAAQNGERGIVGVFALDTYAEQVIIVRPKGIDVSKTYRVTWDNRLQTCEMSGVSLMRDGVAVSLPSPLSSELLLYEVV